MVIFYPCYFSVAVTGTVFGIIVLSAAFAYLAVEAEPALYATYKTVKNIWENKKIVYADDQKTKKVVNNTVENEIPVEENTTQTEVLSQPTQNVATNTITQINTNIKAVPQRYFPQKISPSKPVYNQTPIQTPEGEQIVINQPYLQKTTGKWLSPPFGGVYKTYSMPLEANGDADWSELSKALEKYSNKENFLEYLINLKVNQMGLPNEKNIDVNKLIPVFFPEGGANVSEKLTLLVGTSPLWRIAEAFEDYSDAWRSDPIYYIPTLTPIETLNSVSYQDTSIPNELIDIIKPVDPTMAEKNLDKGLYRFGKSVNPQKILEFAGKVTQYQGGNQAWQQFKKNPELLNDPEFFKTPTSNDILNNNLTDFPSLGTENIVVDSEFEVQALLTGKLYGDLGLQNFPTAGLIPNNYLGDVDKSDAPRISIPDLTTTINYLEVEKQKREGKYPLKIITTNENDKPEEITISDKATAMTTMMTAITAVAGLANFNNEMGLKQTGDLQTLLGMAAKTMSCACNAAGQLGGKTEVKKKCKHNNFNITSAKNWKDFLTGNEVCYGEEVDVDNRTIFQMLEEQKYALAMIKAALFRNAEEIEKDITKIEESMKGTKRKEKFEEFVSDFNKDDKLQINKDYPIKPKINKKSS